MSRQLTRCKWCQGRVEFFGSPFTSRPRKFEAEALDGHTDQAAGAFPVFNGRAWKFVALVAELQVLRECSSVDAEAEARDMPWHHLHDCPAFERATEGSTA